MGESASKSLAAGTRVGDYQITGLLGAGGMGTVYAGEHPLIGKRVAIKILHPSLAIDERMVERFVREARAVVQIGHRNIIDVFTFGEAEGIGHYFVMPLLQGESLGDRIERAGPLAPADAVAVVRQIASALDAAHAAGIYHRDLKPDNVFLADAHEGEADALSVRVLDFGIAKLIHDEVSTTQTGAQMGTPLFMSPEQWAGADVDGRTDVYALGVLTHHVLTGRFPFESDSVMALMGQHATGVPAAPSEHGGDVRADSVVEIALAKNREERFATPGAFAHALETALSGAAKAMPARPPQAVGGTATPAATAADDEPLAGADMPAASSTRWLWAAALVVLAGGLAWFALAGPDNEVRAVAPARPSPSAETESSASGEAATPTVPPAQAPARPVGPAGKNGLQDQPGDATTDTDPRDQARPAQNARAVDESARPTVRREAAAERRARPRRVRKPRAAEQPATTDEPGAARETSAPKADDKSSAKPEPNTPAPQRRKPKDESQWGDTVDPFSSR